MGGSRHSCSTHTLQPYCKRCSDFLRTSGSSCHFECILYHADCVSPCLLCCLSCPQATPYVAAVALLLRNAVPSATAAQVIRCIKATSLAQPVKPAVGDTSGMKRISGGILNAAAALDCVKAAVAALAAPAGPPAPFGPPGASPTPAMQPNPTPSPSPSPKPSPSPSPSPNPSPSPHPPAAGVTCPSTGLPLCVSALTGTLPAAGSRSCPNGKFTLAVRNSSGNRVSCCYDFMPVGYVCRASTGPCVADAVCRGSSSSCPSNRNISGCSTRSG